MSKCSQLLSMINESSNEIVVKSADLARTPYKDSTEFQKKCTNRLKKISGDSDIVTVVAASKLSRDQKSQLFSRDNWILDKENLGDDGDGFLSALYHHKDDPSMMKVEWWTLGGPSGSIFTRNTISNLGKKFGWIVK